MFQYLQVDLLNALLSLTFQLPIYERKLWLSSHKHKQFISNYNCEVLIYEHKMWKDCPQMMISAFKDINQTFTTTHVRLQKGSGCGLSWQSGCFWYQGSAVRI